MLQNHARKYSIPIDSLVFAYKVTDYEVGDPRLQNWNKDGMSVSEDVNEIYPETDGVFIRGLFIEGARWDQHKRVLRDSFPMEMSAVRIFIILV